MKISNQIVIEKARELGFDLVGFAKAERLTDELSHLNEWLSRGYNAGMDYMNRNLGKREDVNLILPGAKCVISLAINYYTDHSHCNQNGIGKISRYAWGKDYHLIVWDKLEILEKQLNELDPDFRSISYVDTGPVMDKSWAVRAGIGWLGKHSNVISKEMGSWFFLSTLITNQEFEYNEPVVDHCGTCRACLDACPTKAIVDDYIVDSNRCISFLTIENKGDIENSIKDNFDNWLFGCDVCQDVCPWNNKFSVVTGEGAFEPANGTGFRLSDVINLSQAEFNSKFETSPLKRAKLNGLKRNANFLLR
ncbi:MAG TPA: tRNA epoxyqueuosine(34) reductase QueG [Melioribacteraceae bacterium]|nr:tRNA epoxyqueuosine(34) reductase QueG [Melioribacteraceae bacterium]